MSKEKQINQIIESCTPDILSGQETVATILERYPQDVEALRPELEALAWMGRARNHLEPSPDFIRSSRKSVELEIEEIMPRSFWQRLIRKHTPQRWAFNITAPALVAFLLVLIVNSLILTARLSIPGEPFYPAKLLFEDIRLAFTFSRTDKTELYIEYSRERTTEFVELVLAGNYQALPESANRLETEIIASLHSIHDLSIYDRMEEQPKTLELQETLSNEISMLYILQTTSPPSASHGIELAIQVAQSGLMALR